MADSSAFGCFHILLLVLSLTHVQALEKRVTGPVPENQLLEIVCSSTADGIMTAKFFVYKNDSLVNMVHFTDNYTPYTDAGCQWTGSGVAGDPFVAEVYIDTATDLPPTGEAACGQVTERTSESYSWTVYAKRQAEFHQDGNLLISFRCRADGLPSELSVELSVIDTDIEGDAIRIIPENELAVLERTTGNVFTLELQNGVSLGQQVKLRVQSKFKDNGFRLINVDHYGVHVFGCTYRYAFAGTGTTFIDNLGCPVAGEFPGLQGGFVHTNSDYAATDEVTDDDVNYRWFRTETDAFVLFTQRPPNNLIYIDCYVGYCYGALDSDPTCNDYCTSNGGKRKRRADDADQIDLVTMVIRINDTITDETALDTDMSTLEGDKNTLIIAVATGIAALLFAVVFIAVCVCCCCRPKAQSKRPRRFYDNSSDRSSGHIIANEFSPNYMKSARY